LSITVPSAAISDTRPTTRIQRRVVLDSFTCFPLG
jgi:hypothetical protein